MWRATFIFAAVLIVGMVILSVRSISHALREPEKTETVTTSEPEEQVITHSRPSPLPSTLTSITTITPPAKPHRQKKHDFSTDFETIKQQEENVKATAESLRRYAKEHPEDKNALSEEEIKRIEQSGSLIQ